MNNKQLDYIISKRDKAKKYRSKITDPEKLKEFDLKQWASINVRRYYYAERCYEALARLEGEQLRIINYTLYYNGNWWVTLDWAASNYMPNRCWWHDDTKKYIRLNEYGVLWTMCFLLRRNNVVVVRKQTGLDRFRFSEIDKIK